MDETFDVKEAAAYLKRSTYTLANWRSRGEGPKYYDTNGSGKIIYYKSDLDKWIRGHEHG